MPAGTAIMASMMSTIHALRRGLGEGGGIREIPDDVARLRWVGFYIRLKAAVWPGGTGYRNMHHMAIIAQLCDFAIAEYCPPPLHFLRGHKGKKPTMKIHEYQAKEILRKYGVPVPDGEMATTLEEADTAAKALLARAMRRWS